MLISPRGNEPLKGSRELGQNRLVQPGVTIEDGIYTANSLHLDCKKIVKYLIMFITNAGPIRGSKAVVDCVRLSSGWKKMLVAVT